MNTRITRLVATLGTAAALGALAAPAAHAQVSTTYDAADAKGSHYDIRQVSVSHGRSSVGVNVKFTDLVDAPSANAGAIVYFDVKASRTGPEYALTTGLGPGTDYQLVRVRNWQTYGEPKTCAHKVTLGYDDNRMRLTAARSCFGSPANVRVAVRMSDHADASHPISDWAPGWKRWTGWLRSS